MPDGEKLFGNPVWYMDVPTRAADLSRRLHNKFAKEAIRETIEDYHDRKSGFAKHWRRDARQRYNHKPRNPKYQAIKAKKYRSTIDIKKTGLTEQKMLSEWKVTSGGNAGDKTLNVTLIVRFPFKGGTGSFRTNKKRSAQRQRQAEQNWRWIEQMKIELQRFDDKDPVELAAEFGKRYWAKVEAHRGSRKRIRISR